MSSRQVLELERSRLAERFQSQPEGRIFAPLADVNRKLGELDAALELCLAGLVRHPQYSSGHLILGKIHLDRGDDVAALEAFLRVLELDPENLLALRQVAELREAQGDFDGAGETWILIAALEPASEEPEQRLAWLRARRDRADDASAPQEVQPASADLRPQHPAESPESETAPEPDFEEIVRVEVEDLEESKDEGASPRESVPLPRQQSDLPSTEIATMTLAEIYAQQGFRAKALDIYRQIEARNPDLPGLHEKIAAIETDLARVERSFDGSRPGPANQVDIDALSAESPESVLAAGEGPRSARSGSGSDVRPSPPLTAPTSAEAEEDAEVERFQQFRGWLDRMRADED